MNLRKSAAWAGVLLLAALVLHRSGTAAPPESAATEKDKPARDSSQDSLAERYARAQLRYAELTLKKAQDMNRKVPQTLVPTMIKLFADDVDYAKMQVENASRSDHFDSFQGWLNRSQIELRSAEAKLKRLIDANRIVPNTWGPIDVERAKLNIELARLRVERGKSLADASSEIKLGWQMEMLSEGLNKLYEMTSLSVQNRLSEFF